MRKGIKFLIYLMAFVMFVSVGVVFGGCKTEAEETTKEVEEAEETVEEEVTEETGEVAITWWVPNWDEEIVKQLLTGFESENPNIKVELVITTWDTMQNQIRMGLMSSTPPDLITELESRILAHAEQGLLANLDQNVTSSSEITKDDIIASALEINSYNGSLYGVPFRHDGSGVYYNKTVFKDADLDPESDCDYAPTNCYIISCI